MPRRMLKGSELNPADQASVLGSYVHRFTGEHRPGWADSNRPNGKPYMVQFKDDTDWLNNTKFHVTKNHRLDFRFSSCESSPTWPEGKGE